MYDVTLQDDGTLFCEFWHAGDYYSTTRRSRIAADQWVADMIATYGRGG